MKSKFDPAQPWLAAIYGVSSKPAAKPRKTAAAPAKSARAGKRGKYPARISLSVTKEQRVAFEKQGAGNGSAWLRELIDAAI